MQDYASDALPLKFASAATIQKLLDFDFSDIGNCTITVLSLAFLQLWSYSVNAWTLPSKNVPSIVGQH